MSDSGYWESLRSAGLVLFLFFFLFLSAAVFIFFYDRISTFGIVSAWGRPGLS